MGSIRITAFGGIRPRSSRTMDNRGLAQIAHNTRLWRGTVAPFNEACKVADTPVDAKVIYRKENCWIVSDNPCASFAEGDTNCPYLFSTGVMPWPAWAAIPACDCDEVVTDLEWKRLGLPMPVAPEIISTETPVSGIVEFGVTRERRRDSRAWVISYVDSAGREGPLSPVSDVVETDINGVTELRFPDSNPDPSYDIAAIRIYRIVGISEDLAITGEMAYAPLFVAQIPYSAGDILYTDDLPDNFLGHAALSEKFYAPPANLEGLIALPNGVLAGFEGRNVWFSEPWDYQAWNCHLNLDDCVKKLVYNSNSIYALTDGHPYVIAADGPLESCHCCRDVARAEVSMPIVCPQSAAEIANGVIWASRDGLAVMRGSSLAVLTDNYIDSKKWREFRPETMRGIVFQGRYFGFSDFVSRVGEHDGALPKGFIFDFDEGTYGAGDVGYDSNLVTHDVPAWSAHVTRDGALYLGYGKEIRRWDESGEPLRYVWRSKSIVERGMSNYAAARVIAEDHYLRQPIGKELHFTLYVDGRVLFTRRVKSGQPFRLPSTRYGIDYEVEISGFAEVNEIHMATSMQELTLVNNA